MNLYLFKGLPGVGKSTVASNLAREISAVYVNKDTINNIIFSHFGANKESSAAVYELLHYIALLLKDYSENLVVDCSLSKKENYDEFQKLCKSNNINLKVIEVFLQDYSKVEERLQSRTDLPEHRIKSISDIKKQGLVYEDYAIEKLIKIENSGEIKDSVNTLLRILQM